MDINAFVSGYNFEKEAISSELKNIALGAGIGAPLGGLYGYFTSEGKESPWKRALHYGLMGGAAGGAGGYFVPKLVNALVETKENAEMSSEAKKLELTPEYMENLRIYAEKKGIPFKKAFEDETERLKKVYGDVEAVKSALKDKVKADPISLAKYRTLARYMNFTKKDLQNVSEQHRGRPLSELFQDIKSDKPGPLENIKEVLIPGRGSLKEQLHQYEIERTFPSWKKTLWKVFGIKPDLKENVSYPWD